MSNMPDEYELEILQEAWEWLQNDNLSFALKLEKQVRAGKTPEQLARTFLSLAGEHRGPRAKRIENAARYLEASSK
ncbi:MAG: hypothetical protein H0W34_05230 [Pyrinomonadaceae bacterium]|nr:hypothetical protein [Pyrinomonadaceae bacterium]